MNQKSKWSFGVLLIAVAVSGADSAGKNAAALEQRLIVNRVDHGRQEVERKGDELVRNANMKLAAALRSAGIRVEMELEERSFKAQMRSANRSQAKFAVLRGDNELASNIAILKNMADGTQTEVKENELTDLIIKSI